MNTFLPPIEHPHGLILKLAYYFTRQQFGKVLTPLKVHSARLPVAFGLFYSKIGKLDKKLTLPAEAVMLIREQVALINVCLFCMDIGRAFTIKASINQAKFDALVPDQRPVHRSRTCGAGLSHGIDKRKEGLPGNLRSPVPTLFNARFAKSSGWSPASTSTT